MKKGLTKIVFVIDRSGSMQSVASDMIGGFNRFIKVQKDNNVGECRVSFYQFDDVYEKVYENLLVQDVQDLTDETFVPRNGTALLDAVGWTINGVGEELNAIPEDQRPEKVLVVILTDGEENSSHQFTSERIKELVEHQIKVYSWEFVYIGANQDTWNVANSIGVANNISYVSSGKNTKSSNDLLWDTLSTKAVMYRSCVSAKMDFSDEEKEQQDSLIQDNTP